MSDFNNDDLESVAERHSQIMAEGRRFFSRLFYGCLMVIILIVGFIIFFFFKQSQFWRYP